MLVQDVLCVEFLPGGGMVSGNPRGQICMWNSGTITQVLAAHPDPLRSMRLSPDHSLLLTGKAKESTHEIDFECHSSPFELPAYVQVGRSGGIVYELHFAMSCILA